MCSSSARAEQESPAPRLTGILNGLSSVGDDYIAVRCAEGRVEAQPILRLMKQDVQGLRRLGLDSLLRTGQPNWQGKIEFDFAALAQGARAERLDIKAILIPNVARAPLSSFRPASARQAMMAIAPSCLYQLHGCRREDFGLIAAIVRALPAFHLDLGEEPTEIAAAVRTFIQHKLQ